MRQKSFHLVSEDRVELLKRTRRCVFVHFVWRHLEAAGYHWTSSTTPQRTLDHRHCRYMSWSSFPWCCWKPSGLLQETDGIRGHDDQSGWGWPWTHHWILHKSIADSSSFGACLPTGGRRSDGQQCVWDTGLEVLSYIPAATKCPWMFQKIQGVQFAWSAPSWSWTMREKYFASWYGKEYGLLLMLLSSTDAQVAPG